MLLPKELVGAPRVRWAATTLMWNRHVWLGPPDSPVLEGSGLWALTYEGLRGSLAEMENSRDTFLYKRSEKFKPVR